MLKKQLEQYVQKKISESPNKNQVALHKEEKEFSQKHGLLEGNFQIEELDPQQRFENAYIERGNKETEELIAQETKEFLEQPISYFKKHKNEFMYMESEWWELIGADAVSFEKDDVFGTYDVMLGLKLQKKYEAAIRRYLSEHLNGEESTYDLMFDANEGLWSLNFSFDDLPGFDEELTIGDAYSKIYTFLFNLAESVETN